MDNYHKYLPVSEEDKNWGLCVLNAGFTNIQPFCHYPFKTHPLHHNFKWSNGRTLHEYQIIYITRGQGYFESNNCQQQIVEGGTIMMLFPDEWHRYKPDEKTGWDEYWIGVSGPVIDNLLCKGYFTREFPLHIIGYDELLIDIFTGIIEKSKLESPGFQPVMSGAVLYLLGHLFAKSKEAHFDDQHGDLVKKAKILFRTNIGNKFSPEDVAEELQVGYSWFRKMFKKHTGLAPGQYFIDLKIQKAKELLRDHQACVKNVAYELKFESVFYFSKIFKEKTGMTPMQFKNHYNDRMVNHTEKKPLFA
jgi:AraC-like DNA-binding protein